MTGQEFNSMNVGDYVEIEIVSNGHLNGGILRGKIVEYNEEHLQYKLESGWCFHPADRILEHKKGEQIA